MSPFFWKKRYSSPTSHIYHTLDWFTLKQNPPRVTLDNASDRKVTRIEVDSVNMRGCLLKVVQVLADLNLIIKRAYISSDGDWFTDIFNVTDELGNKVYADEISERIEQSLKPSEQSFNSMDVYSMDEFHDLQSSVEHTTIELSGTDRPGLLSEIFAVLTDLKCNVMAADMWTHYSRMASVVHITDISNGMPIDDPNRLDKIKQTLLYVLNANSQGAKIAVVVDWTHNGRRLHQIMNDELDCEGNERCKPFVTIEDRVQKGYTVLNIRCPDRPKLIFDTVCTITDMEYVIYHGNIMAEGPVAQQEYFIRHMDGSPISSEPEKERVIQCLEAAIRRRSSEGIRLEFDSGDRVGLLADVTRVFREYGLTIKRAEITTKGTQAVNVFYVADTSGYPVKSEIIEAIKKEVGLNALTVKDETFSTSPPQQSSLLFFGSLFRTKSEKFLYKFGLIKSRPSKIRKSY